MKYGNSKPMKSDSKPKSKSKTMKSGTKKKSTEELMKEHSKHHSAFHMRMMRKFMKEGDSFEKAHRKVKSMEKDKKSKKN